jgi:four helix bundle protein
MKQEEFNEIFRQRTKALSLDIIKIVSELKYSDALGIIRRQLFKSVTSVAANFRAVCRARSDKERYSKLCIVVEEADETLLWIEMLIDGGFITVEKIENPQKEAEEILKVMAAFKKKLERTHQ